MLGIQKVGELARIVDFVKNDLEAIASNPGADVTRYLVCPPLRKAREVISVTGQLRKFQDRIYHRKLKKILLPSDHSFGGVAGRSTLMNAKMHLGQRFVFKADIANFFPSINNWRVNQLFLKTLGCSPSVSRILTKLCTFDFHLALGLVTSPILADQFMSWNDFHIGRLCEMRELVFTRFVDDITISGPFDILNSDIPDKIAAILRGHGFREKLSKREGGLLNGEQTITGLRAYAGKIDVSLDYLDELERILSDHASLGRGGPFLGPLLSESQLQGRINYVGWINHNRLPKLNSLKNRISWKNVWIEAEKLGIAQCKTTMRRIEAAAVN